MEEIRFNSACISCIYNKFMGSVPEDTDEVTRLSYARGILRIIADSSDLTSAPEIVAECTRYKNETFGEKDDFSELKDHFNRLMLALEPEISDRIALSDDPLRSALFYALLGNYIDFGAMDKVDEDKLRKLIDEAESVCIDRSELELLRADLSRAKSLVYLLDNCGEIVFDKLFIKEIMRNYPEIKTTVLVRGENVLNDATMHDAMQVGLCELAAVYGNGTGIAGTCIELLPKDIQIKVLCADVIISKGQGNFETLYGSRKNIYYLFMCKCKMFADRFRVPKLSQMLINDLRMK